MERTKYILIPFILFFSFNNLMANYKVNIYKAYISNDMGKWKNTIDRMNMEINKTNDFILELVNYQYGYIAWCIGNDKNNEGEKYLELAEKNIQLLEKKSFKLSYVNSYKSAFYGFRIGLNVLKAPFIGPKSIDCAELAIKLDKTNPYGYIQYGNSQYYMPAAFGGSKKTAIEYYLEAEKLMAIKANEIKEDWNYLNLLTIIGKAYDDIGNYKVAKLYYEKILKIEPDFLWVKNELYPNIKKKIGCGKMF